MQLVVLALLSTLIASVHIGASPTSETNAERLKRGLSLLKPEFGRLVPGRPTQSYAAKRSFASGTPPTSQYSGRIGVRNVGDSSTVGYVNNWNFGTNYGPVDEELHVTTSGTNPYYNLLSTNPANGAYIGGKYGNQPLAAGSYATAGFGFVTQSSPNAFAVNESAIWAIDGPTRRLTPTFINPDGTAAPTTVAYDIRENSIFFVGDLQAYNVPFQDTPASEVHLFLEDLA